MSKVVVLECSSYEPERIYKKLSYGLSLLGGIESIIPIDKKVLLKPNLLVGIHPDKAATTHPAVFDAVARIIKETGYNVSYGDSPGFGNPDKVANKCGLKEVAEKYDIPLADFVNGDKISYPDGTVSKQFDIAQAVLDTDAIINLPKMKSHAFQRITGAVKNPFGCVVGFNKPAMHARFPNAYIFAEMLMDLTKLLPLNLHIMDGIVAMEGNGPRNGTPTKMNVLLLSTDAVALDAVFCKLVDLNPALIPTNTFGEQHGIGTYHDIELLGDDITPLINKSFDIDRGPVKDSYKMSLKWFRKHLLRRPYIIEEDCKKCGVCVEVCPVESKAVDFKNQDKTKPPIYKYDQCIRCYCCQEMCPFSAIKVKTPVLGKVLYGLKLLK